MINFVYQSVMNNMKKGSYVSEHYNYSSRYPEGLNFDPVKELHQEILSKLLYRASVARTAMQNRFSSWNEIDRTLTAYIDLSEDEKKLEKKDPRNPVSIVVPVTYATLETIKTFLVSAFLNPPILRYDPQGAEDVIGAALLERVISAHAHHYKLPLSLMTMWRDGLAYNCAAAVPVWKTERGTKRIKKRGFQYQDPLISSIFAPQEEFLEEEEVDTIIFEGNDLINIDPYQILPDVTVPLHKLQEGAHFGFTIRSNRLSVLEDEQADPYMFNARYLKDIDGRSVLYESETDDRDRYSVMSYYGDDIEPVDLTYMYVKLIPQEWGLGSKDYPEKWFFLVAGDRIILKAEPLSLRHNKYPIIPCCPDFDGHTLAPISRLEMMKGMQQTINFMYNTRFANIRKSVNDMFLVDPQVINMADITNPKEGMLVRIRERFWGQGKITEAMHQFPVSDVTASHLSSDVPSILSLSEQVTGATQNLQGLRRTTSERVTASEANSIQTNALSRLETTARIISSMSMQPLAYFFAEHAQQFMESGQYVQITGRYEEDLRAFFNKEGAVYASPDQINVNYDIHEHDGSIPGSGDPQSLTQLMQIAAQNPMIFPNLDFTKLLMYVAKTSGAKNFQDFIKTTNNTNMSIQSDESVMNQVNAGNMIPLRGAM